MVVVAAVVDVVVALSEFRIELTEDILGGGRGCLGGSRAGEYDSCRVKVGGTRAMLTFLAGEEGAVEGERMGVAGVFGSGSREAISTSSRSRSWSSSAGSDVVVEAAGALTATGAEVLCVVLVMDLERTNSSTSEGRARNRGCRPSIDLQLASVACRLSRPVAV